MHFQFLPEGIPVRKRLFDLLVTIPALILLSPVFAVISLAVRLIDGRPVLFQQNRPGYRGKIIRIRKFRTMNSRRNKQGELLPDAERISPLGHFLRASSLDELPELFSILSGEMSWVGPRPLLVQYLERYSPEQARRHEVLPGLTGWAQIHGRNALTWPEKFKLDVWYVDHWSLRLDIKILLFTVWKVVKREGISQPGQATAEEFMGNP